MSAIRTACIGAGYFSQFHYEAWRRIDAVELVAAVSLDLDSAKSTGLPGFSDAGLMLEETAPDLVDIITPPQSHFELISRCAEFGVKTVICQKPFCTSLSVAQQAVELATHSEMNLVVHENFRFQPWYRRMKQAIEENTLGDIHQLTFRLRTGDGQGPNAYLDRQPYFRDMKRFLIRETGIHWIDTFRFLLGHPKTVYADLRQLNPAISGEDAGYFLMEFEGGKRALFDANRHLDHDAQNCRTTLGEALLEGTKGTISLAGSGELTLRNFGSQSYEKLLSSKNWSSFGGDCVFALQSHVVSSIVSGSKPENCADDYLAVLELEEAIYKSAQDGRKVSV